MTQGDAQPSQGPQKHAVRPAETRLADPAEAPAAARTPGTMARSGTVRNVPHHLPQTIDGSTAAWPAARRACPAPAPRPGRGGRDAQQQQPSDDLEAVDQDHRDLRPPGPGRRPIAGYRRSRRPCTPIERDRVDVHQIARDHRDGRRRCHSRQSTGLPSSDGPGQSRNRRRGAGFRRDEPSRRRRVALLRRRFLPDGTVICRIATERTRAVARAASAGRGDEAGQQEQRVPMQRDRARPHVRRRARTGWLAASQSGGRGIAPPAMSDSTSARRDRRPSQTMSTR